MPLRNLFKNCAYYWGFTTWIALDINSSRPSRDPSDEDLKRMMLCAMLFLLFEYGNYVCHCILRDLRAPGTKQRGVPVANGNIWSALYNYVSCPNYTYEILAWAAFCFLAQSFAAWCFMACGALQMYMWARKKHKRYLQEFNDYPARSALIPCIL
jgi:very-long-chain enoyl-CoA reductase